MQALSGGLPIFGGSHQLNHLDHRQKNDWTQKFVDLRFGIVIICLDEEISQLKSMVFTVYTMVVDPPLNWVVGREEGSHLKYLVSIDGSSHIIRWSFILIREWCLLIELYMGGMGNYLLGQSLCISFLHFPLTKILFYSRVDLHLYFFRSSHQGLWVWMLFFNHLQAWPVSFEFKLKY